MHLSHSRGIKNKIVRETRLELATSSLEDWHSKTIELHPHAVADEGVEPPTLPCKRSVIPFHTIGEFPQESPDRFELFTIPFAEVLDAISN